MKEEKDRLFPMIPDERHKLYHHMPKEYIYYFLNEIRCTVSVEIFWMHSLKRKTEINQIDSGFSLWEEPKA